jgi:hypothetical protein
MFFSLFRNFGKGWFTVALDLSGKKSECKRFKVIVVNFSHSLLSPVFFFTAFNNKKRGKGFVGAFFYGCFLSINNVAMAIAMIIATTATTM